MAHHLELSRRVIREAHGVTIEIDDLPRVEAFRRNEGHRDCECEVSGETTARNHATGILNPSAKRYCSSSTGLSEIGLSSVGDVYASRLVRRASIRRRNI